MLFLPHTLTVPPPLFQGSKHYESRREIVSFVHTSLVPLFFFPPHCYTPCCHIFHPSLKVSHSTTLHLQPKYTQLRPAEDTFIPSTFSLSLLFKVNLSLSLFNSSLTLHLSVSSSFLLPVHPPVAVPCFQRAYERWQPVDEKHWLAAGAVDDPDSVQLSF